MNRFLMNSRVSSFRCITGGCADLTGLYNCTLHPVSPGVTEAAYGARCRDLSTVLGCNLTSVDPEMHCKTKKSCRGLNGLYLCRKGHCSRVRPPFKCEKKCTGIRTDGKSIIIRENDVIFTANCKRAVDMATNEEIWPKNLRQEINDSESAEPPLLVMYCTTILDRQMNLSTIRMLDCFNGTLMDRSTFGDTTDIVRLVRSHTENTRLLDPTKKFTPPEHDLLISHNVPLYINYEACVNTLILRECEQFHAKYGVDGSDLRANARFPCYYRPNYSDPDPDANFVVLRFDPERTTMELLICSVVPVILACLSCTMLVFCSRVIQVDDESHFYLEMCKKVYKPQAEDSLKL